MRNDFSIIKLKCIYLKYNKNITKIYYCLDKYSRTICTAHLLVNNFNSNVETTV